MRRHGTRRNGAQPPPLHPDGHAQAHVAHIVRLQHLPFGRRATRTKDQDTEAGFLDFNTAFVAEALESCGAQCTAGSLSIAEIDRLRTNPTEMRAVHIARVLDRPEVFGRFLEMVKRHAAEADTVVVPALFGLDSEEPVRQLREAVPAAAPIPTMPPSVAGIRTQQQLRRAFERLGGLFMPGDTAIGAEIREDRVRQIRTANHGEVALQADNYVLASGSFFSKGLVADMTRIAEPLFDLDVAFDTDRLVRPALLPPPELHLLRGGRR